MLYNYIKIILRNLRRYKGYSLLNVGGLALGMACCILILVYVQYEFSYDKHHSKSERIYRIANEVRLGGNLDHWSWSAAPMALALEESFPEVEQAVRLAKRGGEKLVSTDTNQLYEQNIFYADTDVFKVFDYPFVQGNPATALADPFSTVITESIASKYFEKQDVIGQELFIDTGGKREAYRITGVISDLRGRNHIEPEIMISFESLLASSSSVETNWYSLGYVTYALLYEGASPDDVNDKLKIFVAEATQNEDAWYTPYLQPLTDIHLNTSGLGIQGQVDVRYVYMFAAIAVLILVIACINYMNLATARASKRAMEIGVRKVLGAQRNRLALQFLVEAAVFSTFAMLIALLLAEIGLPFFNEMLGKEIQLELGRNAILLQYALLITVFTALISGSYPAFILSNFKPASVIKGNFSATTFGRRIRKGLVLAQFSAGIMLIIGTVIIQNQLLYVQDKDLGYTKDDIITLSLSKSGAVAEYQNLKSAFSGIAGVERVSGSSSTPISGTGRHGIVAEDQEQAIGTRVLSVDYEFIDVYGLEMVDGAWFSKENPNDKEHGFVINETAKNFFGWSDPIGKKLNRNGQDGEVLGVVKDFHFSSLHTAIEPLVLYMKEGDYFMISVKPSTAESAALISSMNTAWSQILPEKPFLYSFLESDYDTLYQFEVQVGKVFSTFSLLALLIASFGLLGLTAYTVEQRIKEIAIRKVLGATILNIITLLSTGFMKLIIGAFLIGSPIAWYMMNEWLQDFAYRTEIGLEVFVISGVVCMLVAFATISIQSFKAAFTNPVENLKNE